MISLVRYLDLVAEDDVQLREVVSKLSVEEFDRLLKEGFNFNAVKRKKIASIPSLQSTDLESWQGKSTEDLIFSIYDKIKDIQVKFPHTGLNPKYRWSVRVQNFRKRIWLLAMHLST